VAPAHHSGVQFPQRPFFKMKKKRKYCKIITLFLILLIEVFSLWFMFKNNPENQKNCTSYNYEKCPSRCVVCPPCEVCSSISCQTEEFCENIGFNRSWFENVKSFK
jgi:hypothetical protein